MEIRRYKPGEEEAIWQIFFDATHISNARDYHPDLIERWAPKHRDMVDWSERLKETNPFVAVEDGKTVGMAEIEENGFINYFYVHPESQGKGIGKALMTQVEEQAIEYGIKRIFADVSITAKTFFQSRGFEITEERSNVIIGHPAPNFRMEKILPIQ